MGRRRGNGEGSIFRRADGQWGGTVSLGYDGSGKRRRKTVYGKTKREVQEKLTRVQSQKLDGTLGEPTRLTVGQFVGRWLADAARPSIRETTYVLYRGVVKNHIVPHLGGVKLAKLMPAHVQAMYTAMEDSGTSPRMRQLTHAVLRRALKQALEWGMAARNVCDCVRPPRVPKRTIQTLTALEAVRLLMHAAEDRFHALYVLAISTGMRQGELFGLQWSDLDLDRRTISVRHTLVEVNGTLRLGEPKSAKSRRLLPLPNKAVAALIEHRKRMVAEGHAASPWVFCDTRGGPLRKSNFIRHSFLPLLAAAQLPLIRFHDLRHTAATLLLQEGVHPKIVQERLGHSQISLTLDTYSHVLPSMQEEASATADRVLPHPSHERDGQPHPSTMATNWLHQVNSSTTSAKRKPRNLLRGLHLLIAPTRTRT